MYGLRSAVLTEIVDDGGVALRRVVGVANIANGHVREHSVASDTGHRDSCDSTRGVKLKDVLPLALQEQHHGLEAEQGGEIRINIIALSLRDLSPVK